MIKFEKFELENGLKVIVHEDHSTPLVCMNLLYNVGSKDEYPEKTGFAHLFEHLMFGGSINIPSYDEPLQRVGGENNAFTSTDITNYYCTIPSVNLETAFWLESDRMLSLAFTDKSLEVQRSVVIEEFKQRYLNQPYGEAWLKLRPLAYKDHSYAWPTIGKEIKHIEDATMQDVKDFFYKFYRPNNCILVLAGNTTVEEVKPLAEKWFGSIPAGDVTKRDLPTERDQVEKRTMVFESDVPVNAIYKAFHMPNRLDENFHAVDLISDILSRGNSSRLIQSLIKEKELFSEITAYITGEIEPGLFVVTGKLRDGVGFEAAEKAIDEEVNKVLSGDVKSEELEKVKNKLETTQVYSEMDIGAKALELAYSELLGDVNRVNTEMDRYRSVTLEDIQRVANIYLQDSKSSVLYYKAKNNG